MVSNLLVNLHTNNKYELMKTTFWFLIGLAAALSICDVALAAGDGGAVGGSLDTAFCNILIIATGTPTKVIAIIAIMATGTGAFTGRLQWTTVIVTFAGIIIIFVAPNMVTLITGEDLSNMCPRNPN